MSRRFTIGVFQDLEWAEKGVQAFDGMFGGHGDGQNQAVEVGPRLLAKMAPAGLEKTAEQGGDAADSNHAVVLPSVATHSAYRQKAPHFVCARPHQPPNRSV